MQKIIGKEIRKVTNRGQIQKIAASLHTVQYAIAYAGNDNINRSFSPEKKKQENHFQAMIHT